MKKNSLQLFFAVLALVSAACTCGGQTESSPLPSNISFTTSVPCVMNQLTDTNAPAAGKFKMDWADQPGAAKYQIEVTTPDGTKIDLESSTSDASIKMDNLPEGDYSALIMAFDPNGNSICMFGWSFGKHSIATGPEKPKKNKEEDNPGDSAQPQPKPTKAPTEEVAK